MQINIIEVILITLCIVIYIVLPILALLVIVGLPILTILELIIDKHIKEEEKKIHHRE